MLEFRCKACDRGFRIEDKYAGKRVKCKCGRITRAPELKLDKLEELDENPEIVEERAAVGEVAANDINDLFPVGGEKAKEEEEVKPLGPPVFDPVQLESGISLDQLGALESLEGNETIE
jgi:hypothetical protein